MAYNRIAGIGNGTSNQTMNNKTVIQTMDNILCFCGNMSGVTKNASTAIFQIPDSMRTFVDVIRFPAVYNESGTYKVGAFVLRNNGYLYTLQALNNATVFLNGICLNINDYFYNDTIGNNNQSNMTYPIGRK